MSALANETRVSILERLEAGEKTVGELADGLPVSRPAISQHLRVLEEAKLVSEEFRGTRHVYRIDLTGFGIVRMWLNRFWNERLDTFEQHFRQRKKDNR